MKKKFIKTPLKGVYVHGAKDVGTRTVNLLMGEHAGEYVRGDIMDANAVIQAFDELKGNVDSEHDSLEEVVDELHNLRDATDQSFEVFQEKAEEETANRIQGDKTLDEKIDQKERESKERDNTLQQNIDTEKQERVNADTQLRNDLTAEVNRAKARENALDSDIQAEATKRENDDNTIKDNLNAEVTRATAKENEIKAEVDVINGDSTTEGSFRKAIADVVGAAPEAYDTLKEIADKLNENDDLHAAINDAIATKATTVALNEEITRAKAAEAENKAEIAAEAARAKKVEGDNALAIQNEVSRATNAEEAINEAVNTEVERAKGQEAYLQNLINTKADTTALEGAKTELDNKLAQKADTTTLNEQVDTLNTAINAKQDAGNYIPYENYENGTFIYKLRKPHKIQLGRMYQGYYYLNTAGGDGIHFEKYVYGDKDNEETVEYSAKGITSNKYNDCLATSDGTFKPISDFVLKTELPTVPTKVSQLTNDSNFITADDIDFTPYATIEALAAVEQKVAANTTAITNVTVSKGIPYDPSVAHSYQIDKTLAVKLNDEDSVILGPYHCIALKNGDTNTMAVNYSGISLKSGDYTFNVNPGGIAQVGDGYKFNVDKNNGVKLSVADGTIYSKMDVYGLDVKLGSDSYTKCGHMTGLDIKGGGPYNGTQTTLNPDQLLMKKSDDRQVMLTPDQLLMKGGGNSQVTITPDQLLIQKDGVDNVLKYNMSWLQVGSDGVGSSHVGRVRIGPLITGNGGPGVVISDGYSTDTFLQSGHLILSDNSGVAKYTTNGIECPGNCAISFNEKEIKGFDIVLPTESRELSKIVKDIYSSKQDKITPTTELDLTSIDTADIESLRSIVKSLATELNTLGLIKLKSAEETA